MANNEKAVMYRLINPDPLVRHSSYELARNAECSRSIVQRLRTGGISAVGEGIARRLADATATPFDEMFEPTGKRAWDR